MRIKLLTTLLFLTMTLTSVHAQLTGGGQGNSSIAKVKGSNPNKWSALHFGLSQPVGKFKENNLTKPFDQAVGAKPGFYFGAEGATYSSASSGNPFKIGFTWNTGLWINDVNWEKWVSGSTYFERTPFLTMDFKMGVIGTYEIAEDLNVDGFLRLGANFGIPGTGEWSNYSFNSEKFAVGFGTSLGTNIRYKKLFTTFQIVPGKLKYTYDKEYKLPITTIRLGVGVVLQKK